MIVVKVVYMYTPLCGTCQVASRMVDVLEQLLPSVTFERQDLNYVPDKAVEWCIESVPCLLIFQHDKLVQKIYAFHSVPYLYETLRKLAE
ncbi:MULTISPECIES: thioredoxin family protein [Anoxybacillus]|uniref:Thioredoxin n=5 Tax=Anoxybacillus TaxID=150247 RepID=A0AAX1ZYL5_9BACL|nr:MULTISPECIES: thioredoxin family protein [Anoxybacillus]QAV25861.1 thioredoxin [Neobacillus thermocopriae]GIW50188.1 MAG: thioredoxin-like protein YusE [Anoxybacillus sp.]ACJ34832.1 Thioredoxin [Anoxybacillus flavithermus WK1]ELK21007.1 thioredoxin [Anoxybacillus flavithermus TNO-09.006]MBE2905213.1 thioredoxin family protein [Anoxybacillus flavithermus]